MGGAERIITTICNHLPREKFQPSLLLFEKVGEYLDFLKEDVEIIEANTKSIRSSLLPILGKPNSFRARPMWFQSMLHERKSDFFTDFIIIFIKSLPKVMI